MGKIVDSLNRIIVAHGGAAVEGSKADVVRAFIKQEEGYEIPASYDTVGAVLERYADIEEGKTNLTFSVKISGEAATADTITLKKGGTIGSGDAVTATDGVYKVEQGTYNYSVAKSGYTTVTGTITISASDIASGSKVIDITLVEA